MPRTVSVDLHIHSEASYDAKPPVELILEHAAAIGLDAIAITDHDTIEASLEAVEQAPDHGILAIPGVEVSTANGHLLAIGVEEQPKPKQTLTATVEHVREQGGLAVVPHPFQRTRHGARRATIGSCDAIEVYNPWLFTGYRNRKARQFAAKHGYPAVANSDAHRLGMIGRAYTEIPLEDDAAVTREAILEAIREPGHGVHGKRKPVWRSAKDYGRGMARKTLYTAERAAWEPVRRVASWFR